MTKTVLCILVSLTLWIVALPVSAASADFEAVLPIDYAMMLRNAKKAYEGKRYDEAFRGFQRTACAGDKESQSAMGRMYLLGQGVTRNDISGYAWLKVAAETKMRGYQSIVDKLEQAMTAPQRAVADPLAATLISQYGLRASHMSCNLSASRGGLIQDGVVCTPRTEGNQFLLRRCVANNPPSAK